jgi:hypothetical protein
MSADNWSVCPKCKEVTQKEFDKKVLSVGNKYGEVAPEDFIELFNNLPKEPEFKTTLREDYEFYLDTDEYELSISYHASCGVCGFKYEFKKVINIVTGVEAEK